MWLNETPTCISCPRLKRNVLFPHFLVWQLAEGIENSLFSHWQTELPFLILVHLPRYSSEHSNSFNAQATRRERNTCAHVCHSTCVEVRGKPVGTGSKDQTKVAKPWWQASLQPSDLTGPEHFNSSCDLQTPCPSELWHTPLMELLADHGGMLFRF